MSPIGRIFIVVNLLLAGTFVGFSGTYLQQATNWKEKFETEVTEHTADNEAKDARNAELSDKYNDESRKLSSSEANLSREKAEKAGLQKENERLTAQFDSMAADLKGQTASLATISSSVETQANNAESARQAALAHLAEKDKAVRTAEVATSDLADANNEIAHLKETVVARESSMSELGDKIKQQDILLAVVKVRAPGLLVFAQPFLSGTVQHVGANGKLLTVAVTDNPGDNKIEKGYRFAIFDEKGYKGEATITEIDGNNAFCRFDGTGKVAIGDGAKTNLN